MASDTHWHPARYLYSFGDSSDENASDGSPAEALYAVIILNCTVEEPNTFIDIYERAKFRVAADGGAERISEAGDNSTPETAAECPEIIAGDLDSIDPDRLQSLARYSKVVKDDSQYRTDFEKSLTALYEHYDGPSLEAVLVLGGLSGRVDQAFAQLHQLYRTDEEQERQEGISVFDQGPVNMYGKEVHTGGEAVPKLFLIAGKTVTFVLRAGKHVVHLRQGDDKLGRNVGIIPLGSGATISTKGLQWDVTDWDTRFGGQLSTSNYVVEDDIEVTTNRRVLFTVDFTPNIKEDEYEYWMDTLEH